MTRFFLFFFLIPLLKVYGSELTTVEEKTLCGERPKDEREEILRREDGEHLSKILPPVSSQNPASWCFAFASAPLIEHHRFMKIFKEKGIEKLNKVEQEKFAKEFYLDPANRLSPFEAVYSSNTQLSLLHPDEKNIQSFDPDEINLKKGGKVLDVFWGIQERGYRVRSAKQVKFISIDDEDSEAREVITALIDRYKQDGVKPAKSSNYFYEVMGCRVDATIYNTPEFREFLKSLGLINQKLEKLAEDNQAKTSSTLIRRYGELSSLLNNREGPDFEIPPYTTSILETDDVLEFLKRIKLNLASSKPLSMSLCAFDEEFSSLASSYENSSDQCGPHVVNIVGAYYRGKKCVVKLRNTWGIDWPHKGAGGHKEVSVQDLLKLQERLTINRPGNTAFRKMKYEIEWIDAPFAPAPRVYSNIKSPVGIFEGEGSLRQVSEHSLRPYFKNGTLQHPNGDQLIYVEGRVIRFNRNGIWYKLRADGKFYP